ncbi:MAG TPA: TIM barrel protein [Spirochaetota bacterium]|jgi:sugar phosphate isomerase/epimerase|nr:TIM barrel protein [Spirochaetota bacterium]OPZ36507.1 MAG: Xylose isomerase-like TIM barrel [Spirochaetes bacterium ADurb.BinA120]HNU90614.1 TIM barrel protein [Spirochaetota bacterium]HPO45728.1 TIM barrel protein [Spirochaetota bacterium]HPV98609.1 TIM barrel protein [Spirochaetota bacterium]
MEREGRVMAAREMSESRRSELASLARDVFICMPVRRFDDSVFALLERYRFNLEIGVDHYAMDRFPPEHFAGLARRLSDLGIATTVHAPFHELFPGAPDRLMREAALTRLDAAFDIMRDFSPRSIVMHLNHENRRFGFVSDDWFSHIVPAIERYAKRSRSMGAMLVLENVYEEDPSGMVRVLKALPGADVHHCLDVGHLNAFSKTGLDEWLAATGPFIRQFHLHDNDGSGDSHGPIGSGAVRFDRVAEFIGQMGVRPIITLEPHNEPDIWRTLDGLRRTGILGAMAGLRPA